MPEPAEKSLGDGFKLTRRSLLLPTERHDLLVRLLRFSPLPEEIGALRIELLSDMSALEALMVAASRRQLVSAVISQLKLNGILHPRPAVTGERETIVSQLARLDEEFSERRAMLTEALRDIIAQLNGVGIEPLILKGSMSLITGEPDWRFQRDIDFAVYPEQASATVAALGEAGFVECADTGSRPHHLRPMERAGLRATVEPHVKLAGARARAVLPDEVLLKTVTHETWNGLEYLRLSDAGFVLHGLAHHHFQNRGYIYGSVSLKGLIEFAFAISRLERSGVLQLMEIADGNERLKGGLRLWCALAERLLNVTLPDELTVDRVADQQARMVARRHLQGRTASPAKGLMEHVALAEGAISGGNFRRTVLGPIRDICHSAVWWDYEGQRRNASGILSED